MATPIAAVTSYDQFNIEVPENEFPKTGISARAAEALVFSQCGFKLKCNTGV